MTALALSRVAAVMVKEFRQLSRDRLTYAMMLVMPVIQLLLFGYAINSEPRHLPTAVLVQEDGRFARSILAALDNSDFFDITVQAESPEEIDDLLRRGEVLFGVTVPGDFSERLVKGDGAQILVEADATDPTAT
ncbi:MAG: ABC transporter permease, partial [Caulobacteraceae bacterium]|nr:ABC transporter permease [Caulobacteraceae bacterium]